MRFYVFSLAKQYSVLISVHAAIIAFCWILFKEKDLSRFQLFYFYSIFFSVGVTWRTITVILLKIYRATGHNTRRYVVVGYGKLSLAIKHFYENHPEIGFQFHGFFDQITPENRYYLRGDFERLEALLATRTIDCVYCCSPYLSSEVLSKLMEKSPNSDFQVKLIIDFTIFSGKRFSIEYHDMMPVISVSNQMWEDVRIKWLKRGFDIVFSLLVLILGSPVFTMLMLITKITSKGPAFFSQTRTGKAGKKFKIHKFRSMYINAYHGHSSEEIDRRITPWGRFMRKTRIDEIPQFYNVLKGDMSIVGPRPLADYDVQTLLEIAPDEFSQILAIKPGITSIGQVIFGYATTKSEMRQRLKYDLIYLKKISLFFDLWVIMQTVLVMVKAKGR